jgi:hypothetical protein
MHSTAAEMLPSAQHSEMPEWTEQDLLTIEKDIKKYYRQSIPKFNGENSYNLKKDS